MARELNKSPLYIHKLLRDAGIIKQHGVYMVTEAELAALKKARAATAKRQVHG